LGPIDGSGSRIVINRDRVKELVGQGRTTPRTATADDGSSSREKAARKLWGRVVAGRPPKPAPPSWRGPCDAIAAILRAPTVAEFDALERGFGPARRELRAIVWSSRKNDRELEEALGRLKDLAEASPLSNYPPFELLANKIYDLWEGFVNYFTKPFLSGE
jgi:hypothetical protein